MFLKSDLQFSKKKLRLKSEFLIKYLRKLPYNSSVKSHPPNLTHVGVISEDIELEYSNFFGVLPGIPPQLLSLEHTYGDFFLVWKHFSHIGKINPFFNSYLGENQ